MLRRRLRNPTLETTLVLLVPFTAYLASEELHASGILAVVVAAFGITVNISLDPRHQYPGAYRTRLQEEAFWPVADFLLETFVFAYIGLQLRFVLSDLAASDQPGLTRTLVAAAVLLVVAIVLRIAGVHLLFGNWALRHRRVLRRAETDERFRDRFERYQQNRSGGAIGPPTVPETFLVGWTGMRGILTLAAAAAVPTTIASGEEFAGRDAIAAIALVVTLGTLLVQGTTLRAVVRLLHLDVSAEQADDEETYRRGLEIISAVTPSGAARTDDEFDAERMAVRSAVAGDVLDEATARSLITDLDLRQAASHTFRE